MPLPSNVNLIPNDDGKMEKHEKTDDDAKKEPPKISIVPDDDSNMEKEEKNRRQRK